jgi:hypothetical protein
MGPGLRRARFFQSGNNQFARGGRLRQHLIHAISGLPPTLAIVEHGAATERLHIDYSISNV